MEENIYAYVCEKKEQTRSALEQKYGRDAIVFLYTERALDAEMRRITDHLAKSLNERNDKDTREYVDRRFEIARERAEQEIEKKRQ